MKEFKNYIQLKKKSIRFLSGFFQDIIKEFLGRNFFKLHV